MKGMGIMDRINLALLATLLCAALLPAVPAGATETKTLPLGAGFNFVALPLQPEPAVTAAGLLAAHPDMTGVFKFSPTTQAFAYVLRLSNGGTLGGDFSLDAGTGYILRTSKATPLPVTGATPTPTATKPLSRGFNFFGPPAVQPPPKAKAFLAAHPAVQSIFQWDTASAAFTFVIRLGGANILGNDFDLRQERGFIMNATAETQVDFTACGGTLGSGDGGGGGGGGSTTENGLPGSFTMVQTLSDQAQLMTISAAALAFMTGNFGSDTFFPPGKVTDYWGFQYLRDNDPTQMGHNTSFLTRASNNMLKTLTTDQRARLITLAKAQVATINAYAESRFLLIDAFRRHLESAGPAGNTGLDESAVKAVSRDLYLLDGRMAIERAAVMGALLHELTTAQRAPLDALKGTGMLTWPDLPDVVDKTTLTHDEHVAVMTYAGDMFSWYMGSLDADVYFCPERQGTYFGGFYFKDAPAMGNPNYTIPSNLTADSGKYFLEALDVTQAAKIRGLVDSQRAKLDAIVTTRTAIARELRKTIEGGAATDATVIAQSGTYGDLDGELVYDMAVAFAEVYKSLTPAQKTAILKIRSDYEVGVPTGAFLYSSPIASPTVPNTDYLFAK